MITLDVVTGKTSYVRQQKIGSTASGIGFKSTLTGDELRALLDVTDDDDWKDEDLVYVESSKTDFAAGFVATSKAYQLQKKDLIETRMITLDVVTGKTSYVRQQKIGSTASGIGFRNTLTGDGLRALLDVTDDDDWEDEDLVYVESSKTDFAAGFVATSKAYQLQKKDQIETRMITLDVVTGKTSYVSQKKIGSTASGIGFKHFNGLCAQVIVVGGWGCFCELGR